MDYQSTFLVKTVNSFLDEMSQTFPDNKEMYEHHRRWMNKQGEQEKLAKKYVLDMENVPGFKERQPFIDGTNIMRHIDFSNVFSDTIEEKTKGGLWNYLHTIYYVSKYILDKDVQWLIKLKELKNEMETGVQEKTAPKIVAVTKGEKMIEDIANSVQKLVNVESVFSNIDIKSLSLGKAKDAMGLLDTIGASDDGKNMIKEVVTRLKTELDTGGITKEELSQAANSMMTKMMMDMMMAPSEPKEAPRRIKHQKKHVDKH